jgi:ribonuclease BN (tRNA processing enzyme)
MHVTDLVVHAHKFHNEAIMLIHFSPRYKKQVRPEGRTPQRQTLFRDKGIWCRGLN